MLCLGVLSLGACSDNINVGEEITGGTHSSDMVYFALRISDVSARNALATRADRFDSDNNDEYGTQGYIFNKGLNEEKAIYGIDKYVENEDDNGPLAFQDSPHRALVFDENNRKIGDLFLRSVFTPPSPDDTPDAWDTYTILYTTVPKESMLKMQDAASKILVVLNANPTLLEKIDALVVFKDIKNLVDSRETLLYFDDKESSQRFFTMSSSIVIKDNTIVPSNDLKNIQYYSTKKEALDNASNFTMYVERLQVKYTLLFQTGTDTYKYFDSSETSSAADVQYSAAKNVILESGTDFKPVEENLRCVISYTRGKSVEERGDLTVENGKWKVNFTGWGLNALEKEEYLFKNINNTTYFDNWHVLGYRNFWAEDKTYTTGTYPDQYRTSEEIGVTVNAGQGDKANSLKTGLSLDYFSYNQLNAQELHQYSPESTFDNFSNYEEDYDDLVHLRAGTHLIINAQLLIKDFDDEEIYNSTETDASTGLITSVKDKYLMNDIYWSADAYKEYVAEYLGFWMLTDANVAAGKFGPNDGVFYVSKQEGNTTIYEPADKDDFQIVSANIKGGDGMVWVKPSEGKTLYTYNENAEAETKKYKEISDEQFKTLAFEHKEYFAKHYNEGRMYYPVPVRHNITGSSLAYKTGDFGSVRNHWYYFTVQNIATPGAPVDEPGQPIIPNKEPLVNGLGVNIKILDWNQIGTTIENILEQNHSQQ